MRARPRIDTLVSMGEAAPRILVTAFAPVPGSSPAAASVLSLVAAVRGNIDLITMKTNRLAHSERLLGAQMFRVPVGHGEIAEQRQRFGRAIGRQLDSERYDVVHVQGPSEGSLIAPRKQLEDFRLVYEVSSFPETEQDRGWLEDHERCCEHADLILVPTQAAARAMAERGHGGKAAVLSPGVDIDRFDWWPASSSEVLRLLFLGAFRKDRDLDTLLAATERFQKQHPVEVLIAGDSNGARRAELRDRVAAFGLSNTVQVQGEPSPEQLARVIGAADLCICTAAPAARFQEFGDVPAPLLEFLACRRAVIAAAVPGIAEIAGDRQEALHYVPGHLESLLAAIEQLADKREFRSELVASAHHRVHSAFSGGARRRRLAEIYELLCTGSQVFDPWNEAFDYLDTGHSVLPPPGADSSDGDLESNDTSRFLGLSVRATKDTIDATREELGLPELEDEPASEDAPAPRSAPAATHRGVEPDAGRSPNKKSAGPQKGGRRLKRS